MSKLNFENFRQQMQSVAQAMSDEISSQMPTLRMHYILFRRGQRQDQIEKVLNTLSAHPCYISAKDLLRSRNLNAENTEFFGIAAGVEKSFFGLKSQNFYLAFVAINLDQFKDVNEGFFELYHLTAQALETFKINEGQKLKTDNADIFTMPKRNQLALSRNNLKSDIFSVLMMLKLGAPDAINKLAVFRAYRTLQPQSSFRPEDYPYPIATDIMDFSVRSIFDTAETNLLVILKIAEKIAVTFDKFNLKSWSNFVGPAQTMAWNGFTEEQILGIALSTSSDPFIKATANILAEITQLVPDTLVQTHNVANPFVEDTVNKTAHKRMSEETFENAIVHAVEADSHLPLIRLANNQNEALLKGRMVGWCANALQSAAITFEQTLKKGLSPAPASRIEFQRVASKSDWEALGDIGNFMVGQKRLGAPVTFHEISEWSKSRFDLRPIMDSVQLTLSDPEYAQKLNYTVEAPKPKIMPKGPAASPSITPNLGHSAAPRQGYSNGMPGMGIPGGSMMGGGIGAGTSSTRQLKTPNENNIDFSKDDE